MPLPEYDDNPTFTFTNPALVPYDMGPPQRIVVHRQGNPGAMAENSLKWGDRTGAFSIHYYVQDGVVWSAIPPRGHARHVSEARIARSLLLPTTVPGVPGLGERGDVGAIGIECVDIDDPVLLLPGQTVGLTQRTRQSLLRLVWELCVAHQLQPDAVSEHADWDPWQRAADLGDALYMPDFRLDLADLLAGREPWRTVGPFARGLPNTSPAPAPGPGLPVPPSSDEREQLLDRISSIDTSIQAAAGALDQARVQLGRARDLLES